MADIFLFIRHGWKSIWKQKIIWLFSALPILYQLFSIFHSPTPSKTDSLLWLLLLLITTFVFAVLSTVSLVGVPYLVYCSLIGQSVTIQETLSAVKKYFFRVAGCSCLGALVYSPLYFGVLFISMNSSTHTLELSYKTFLVVLVFSIADALWLFTLALFFENDWGIPKSLGKAWNLFKDHFIVLAILGLLLIIAFEAYSMIVGLLTVFIQSGFDITSISHLNLFNLPATLNKNLLFVLLNGIGSIISAPLSASIFISAYLKYGDVKLPYLLRVS